MTKVCQVLVEYIDAHKAFIKWKCSDKQLVSLFSYVELV